MLDYIHLGKKIYNTDNPREARRMAVFVVRCLLNNSRMQRLHQFFSQNDLYRKIADEYPFVYEQPTRAFIFSSESFFAAAAGSEFSERSNQEASDQIFASSVPVASDTEAS